MKLLYFRGDGCSVCEIKRPVAEEIARRLGLPLEVLAADGEDGRARAEELRIRTVPTLALVDGARVRFRLVGRLITPENAARLTELTRPPEPDS